jgi:hypothetical protein
MALSSTWSSFYSRWLCKPQGRSNNTAATNNIDNKCDVIIVLVNTRNGFTYLVERYRPNCFCYRIILTET